MHAEGMLGHAHPEYAFKQKALQSAYNVRAVLHAKQTSLQVAVLSVRARQCEGLCSQNHLHAGTEPLQRAGHIQLAVKVGELAVQGSLRDHLAHLSL